MDIYCQPRQLFTEIGDTYTRHIIQTVMVNILLALKKYSTPTEY